MGSTGNDLVKQRCSTGVLVSRLQEFGHFIHFGGNFSLRCGKPALQYISKFYSTANWCRACFAGDSVWLCAAADVVWHVTDGERLTLCSLLVFWGKTVCIFHCINN